MTLFDLLKQCLNTDFASIHGKLYHFSGNGGEIGGRITGTGVTNGQLALEISSQIFKGEKIIYLLIPGPNKGDLYTHSATGGNPHITHGVFVLF
jgi:hypothetical protein